MTSKGTDEKIDRILQVVEELNSRSNALEKAEGRIKTEITNYMLKHFNISWIDDSVERGIYDTLGDVIIDIINKHV